MISLSGLRLRYLIGKDSDDGEEGAFTVVGYDATQPPSKGIGAKYINLFDEKNSGAYGPYLTSSDTAQQYSEGQCDPAGPGFWQNVTDQLKRAKAQGFTILGDIDNRDAYHNADVLKVYDQAYAVFLPVICKNPGISDYDEDSTELLKHPAVIGCIIEKSEVTPEMVVVMRTAANKPELPVWFVSFGSGRTWAEQTAAKIKAAHYVNMGVTYSSQGEYGSSEDVLVPLAAADHPLMTSSFPYGQAIKKLMLSRGYPWFPDQNIVTVETMNDDGSLCLTGPNTFDDQKMILDGDGNVIGGPWDATSHPGTYWTENPMASGGAFIIALGPQTCWGPPGDYHGLTVWRQSEDGTILGHRDPNDTYVRQGAPVKYGNIGVHHHGGYNLSKGDIANAAAGCQVIRLTASQAAFMKLTQQCPRYLADPQGYRLTATVLTAQDVLDAHQSILQPTPTPVPAPAPSPIPPVLPVPQPPNISTGLVLDTADDVTDALPALKAAGYTTVIRYLTTNTSSSKCIKPAEARAIAAAGMRLGLVFEVWGGVNNFSHDDINASTGAQHAAFCNGYLPQLGVPNGAGVYFAIDTDVTAAKIQSLVLPYFKAVRATLAGQFRVGAYGCGAVNQAALDAGCISLAWLANATSWNGSKAFAASGKAVLVQKLPQTIAGLDADPDVRMGDIGDFVPFSTPLPSPTPLPIPSPIPIPVPAPIPQPPVPLFSQDGFATWYSDNANASGSPVNNAIDRTAAHNTLPFGTVVRVTRTDTNALTIVTIQDRGGPGLSGNRIIDLRPVPAAALDMIDAGVVPVHLETVSVLVTPPPTPVIPVVIPPTPPPVVPTPPAPPIVNLPSTEKQAAISAALAEILTAIQNDAKLQADIKVIFGGVLNPSGSSLGSTLLSAASSFFGVWAIPIAAVGYGILSLLQNHGTVTDPTTVATATGGAVVLGGTGLVAVLQKVFNVFGQIATAVTQAQKGNQP